MAKNTIRLKNYSDITEEYVAGGTITPGHLISLNSSDAVVVHAVSGGTVLPMFALEDALQGKGITDNYSSTNQVQVWVPGRGDIVNALLKDGENVVKGDFLASGGDGTLIKATAPDSTDDIVAANSIVGVALEAVNMTVSNDPDGRIAVRII